MVISRVLFTFIIHQIFSLTSDWSKQITRPNIPQLKLGDIQDYKNWITG